jgi:hypothetical protein
MNAAEDNTHEDMRLTFESTGNPYFAWFVIDRCAEANKPLPTWVFTYLAQCAGRMLSMKAQQTSDLRKVLPWVLDFPKKRGPGNPLSPVGSPERLMFDLEFGIRVLRRDQDPVTARRDACNAVFRGKEAEVDDKTLLRWLLEDFNLRKAPKNSEQWKEAIRKELEPLRPTYERTKSRETLT